MDLVLNDLSVHGQFKRLDDFIESIDRIMLIRNTATESRILIYCHRSLLQSQVTPSENMFQAVKALTRDQRNAFLLWANKQGPFWDDYRNHTGDDWFESKDIIVTDTALGEAAWCNSNGIERGLISFAPSDWTFTPITVNCFSSSNQIVNIDNFWDSVDLKAYLNIAQEEATSWKQLNHLVKINFTRLVFQGEPLEPLDGHPFYLSAAKRILILLDILNRMTHCFDEQGRRTPEGQDLYQKFFTGEKALFTDSSDAEKQDFANELNFPHPKNPGERLFCPWHGKIKTPQLRIHFSWPIRPLIHVPYIGPKITKY